MTGEIMIPLILETKFGNVKLNDDGYYIITSRKEGNNGKIFHRLVWEDWYGIQVPKGYVNLEEEVKKRGLKWEQF